MKSEADDESIPSFATLELFDQNIDDDEQSTHDGIGGNQVDATIAEAQSDLLQGQALLQELAGIGGQIRQRARALLQRGSGVEPMGEEANPYKKRAAELSVEALAPPAKAKAVDNMFDVAALADTQFEDEDGDWGAHRAPMN
jgi:hypothetical protein